MFQSRIVQYQRFKKIALEVLDELLTNVIPGAHFLESIMVAETVFRVHPLIVRPKKSEIQTKFMQAPDLAKKMQRASSNGEARSFNLSPVRQLKFTQKILPPSIKLAIVELPPGLQEIGQDVVLYWFYGILFITRYPKERTPWKVEKSFEDEEKFGGSISPPVIITH